MIGLKEANQEGQNSPLGTVKNILTEKKGSFLALTTAFFIIYSFLFGLWKIPFIEFGINRLSEITLGDYLFILIITLLASLFFTLWSFEQKNSFSSNSSVGGIGGGIAGIIAGVCPVCQSIGIVGLGTTFLNIPTNFLTPYLDLIRALSIGLLGLAVFLKIDSIHTKTCRTFALPKITKKNTNAKSISNTSPGAAMQATQEPLLFRNNLFLGAVSILVVLLFVNQMLVTQAYAVMTPKSNTGSATVSLGSFEYGPKITLKPMPLAVGEQPRIQSYKTIVKPLPTISELAITPSTGDPAQDLLNNIVPTGTPWYGQEASVSFDDPIAAQNKWGQYRSLQLSSAEQERWNRIANSFTCDYCCGSPQNPTIITRCGCAHAAAAQGMAKWFIKNHGDNYSDEEIYGEMARWYALWYPKGTIERIILESQA